jgi:molybdopterin-synthase adenylyltransferase
MFIKITTSRVRKAYANNGQHLNIAVVGSGALGSGICKVLAEHSFSKVLVIDPDRLEPRNVPFSSLYQDVYSRYGTKAFAQFKAELLVNLIREQHTLPWTSMTTEIADVGLGRLAACDLIISCTDSTLARIETAIAARAAGLPMLDGGVMGEGIAAGRVSWFPPVREAACYLCGISEIRRAELLSYAVSTSLGCKLPEEASSMTGTHDAIKETAATMFQLIEAFCAGESQFESSFALRLENGFLQKTWTHQDLKLPRSATCPWHDELTGEWRPLDYDRPVRDALDGSNMRLELSWPQCIEANCRLCGYRSSPNKRVALVRRKMVCAQCGTIGSYEPVKVINSLGAMDAAAAFTPRQLGLPEQHLYLFRRTFTPVRIRKEVNEPVA